MRYVPPSRRKGKSAAAGAALTASARPAGRPQKGRIAAAPAPKAMLRAGGLWLCLARTGFVQAALQITLALSLLHAADLQLFAQRSVFDAAPLAVRHRRWPLGSH